MSLRTCHLRAALVAALALPAAAPALDPAASPQHPSPAAVPWSPPSGGHAAQPALALAADGSVHASWIERHGDRHRLRVAHWRDGRFSDPVTVTEAPRGDWFVNWADFPRLVAGADGGLASFVLERSGAMPYAYDIRLFTSADGGARWADGGLVHDDGTESEHGFVALWPEPGKGFGIAWLDGRDSPAASGHEGHGSGEGAMSLRAARFGGDGNKQDEQRLDARTCDCCQTDAAITDAGPIVVYRDRSEAEVRDIAIARRVDGAWLAPQLVHEDGWVMPACPVNGPAVAASGQLAWVAWYTAAGDRPLVRLARSADGGASFGAPVDASAAEAGVQGRVDLAVHGDLLYLAQLAGASGGLMLDARGAQDLALRWSLHLDELGPGRGGGFPQLLAAPDALYLLATRVRDGAPRLAGWRIEYPGPGPAPAPGPASRPAPSTAGSGTPPSR